MATRRERVVLELVDDFTSDMARAAAATALLDRELGNLDGSTVNTTRSTERATRATRDYSAANEDARLGLDRLSASAVRGDRDIDRYSGRLGLLLKTAAALGPSLIPVGAVAIPAVTGLAAQLGFAAGAAGIAILAFQGIGDTLEAVNKAALEPTAENLKAAREAMQQLSPAGRDLVRQLEEMKPLFHDLRDTAAEGLFPGVIEGFEALEQLAPRVNSLIAEVADTLGDIFADSAESLASDRWAGFFDMLEREARPTLTDLASAIGSFAHGLGELWTAFAPLNRSFGSWLSDVARSFDDWAAGLAQTEGFKEFIAYIRENGPLVGDAVLAISNALLQIVEAAAPLGGPVLRAITGIANAIAAIADSPLGTPIMAGVTAISALSLASTVATASVTRLNAAMATLGATSKTTGAATATGAGAAGAAGGSPYALPIIAALYGVQQYLNNTTALFQHDMPLWEYSLRGLVPAINIAEDLGLKIGFIGDEAEGSGKQLGSWEEAAHAALEGVGGAASALGEALTRNTPLLQRADHQLERYNEKLRANRQAAKQAAEGFVDFGHKVKASEFTLDGWLDKIEQQIDAMRDFRRNAEEAGRKGLDEGLIQHLRELGPEGALQLKRLADASDKQISRANQDWRAFTRESNLAGESVNTTQRFLEHLGQTHAKPTVEVKGAKEAAAAVARVKAELDLLHDKQVNVTVTQHGFVGFDSGGYTGNGDPREVAGVVHRREVVIPENLVKRDWPMLKSRYGHLPGFADGGLVGGSLATRSTDSPLEQMSRNAALALKDMASAARENNVAWSSGDHGGPLGRLRDRIERASRALKAMEKALDKQNKAVDKQAEITREAFDAVQDVLSEMASFQSDISGRLTTGLFDNGADFSSVTSGLKGNEAAGDAWVRALAALQRLGLDGPALSAVLQQATLEQLQQIAAWTPQQIQQFEDQFGASVNATQTAGALSSQMAFGQQLAEDRARWEEEKVELREAKGQRHDMILELREQNKKIKHLEHLLEKAPEETGKALATALDKRGANAGRK